MLTQKRMKELLTYDRDTGIITRTNTISGNAVKGMVAGTVKPNGIHGEYANHGLRKAFPERKGGSAQ